MTTSGSPTYPKYFEAVTDNGRFGYQKRLGEHSWPHWLDVPTGMCNPTEIIMDILRYGPDCEVMGPAALQYE